MSVTAQYTVTGMTCGHCVKAVTDELSELDGVVQVDIHLPAGQVTVTSNDPLARDAVAAPVDQAGYTLVS